MKKSQDHKSKSICCADPIKLPKIWDSRGNLTFVESEKTIPFEIRRVFYLYDVPSGSERGGHALKNCHQLLIALSGSFEVSTLTQDQKRQSFVLNRPDQALHLGPMIWRELLNFSAGAVCLVLASKAYEEKGYYRDLVDFLNAK